MLEVCETDLSRVRSLLLENHMTSIIQCCAFSTPKKLRRVPVLWIAFKCSSQKYP